MNRRGFTLIEMMIVSVMGAVVVMSIFQVIASQQKAFTVNSAGLDARRTLRAGMDILTGELREVSTLGGDLLAIDDDSIQIRAPKDFGLVCQVGLPSFDLTVRPVRGWLSATDSVFVFADGDITLAADDTWLLGQISASDTTATCAGEPAQTLTLDPALVAAAAVDSIRVGAPVRTFEPFSYGLTSSPRGWFLSRWSGSRSDKIVGPLEGPGSGVVLEYFDENGVSTAVPADVRAVRITLRASRDVIKTSGDLVGDSLSTTIQLRN